jgi:hypothetical protein
MSSFVERRKPIWQSAITLAAIFGAGVVVAVVFGGVPTWQTRGPATGPGFVRRATEPVLYYSVTLSYAGIAAVSSLLAFFRFPWVTITHVRLLILAVFLLLLAQLLYFLTIPSSQERAQAAWNRVEALGGHAVQDSDMVAVSLADTGVTDDDLALLADLPGVQILDLSHNKLSDNCLKHLNNLESLKSLILVGTAINPEAIEQFRSAHPTIEVRTEPSPKKSINPATGK